MLRETMEEWDETSRRCAVLQREKPRVLKSESVASTTREAQEKSLASRFGRRQQTWRMKPSLYGPVIV